MNLGTGWVAKEENRTPSACTSVVVSGLPCDTTSEEIRTEMGKWGKVEDINNQAARYGFAFVKYVDAWLGTEGVSAYNQVLYATQRKGVFIKGTVCKVMDSKTPSGAVMAWRKELRETANKHTQVSA